MGCFVVAGFVLTSVSCSSSAIAELLVKRTVGYSETVAVTTKLTIGPSSG